METTNPRGYSTEIGSQATIVIAPCLLLFGGSENELNLWLRTRWPGASVTGPPRPRIVRVLNPVDLLGYDPRQCAVGRVALSWQDEHPWVRQAWKQFLKMAQWADVPIVEVGYEQEAANETFDHEADDNQ